MSERKPPATVRTDTGHPIIDVHAWIAARIGAPHPHLTATLRALAGVAPFRDRSHPRIAWADLAVAWCVARGYQVAESAPLWHDSPRLSDPFAVVLATSRRAGAIAVVTVDDDPPTVYADATTEEGYWYDATTVTISCPTGHGWTWHGDGTLLDDDEGRVNPIRFSPALTAPLQRCDQCVAYDENRRREWCDCDGSYQVICPDCNIRCHLDMPDVPRYPDPHSGPAIEVVWEISETFRDRFTDNQVAAALNNDDNDPDNDDDGPDDGPRPANRLNLRRLMGSAGGDLDALLADREHPAASIGVTARCVTDVRRVGDPPQPAAVTADPDPTSPQPSDIHDGAGAADA